jgi:hypothetical protein
MEEKVRFVWEEYIRVELKKAKKFRSWVDMKNRFEEIEEALNKIEKIKELAEKAQEFGVLEVTVSLIKSEIFEMEVVFSSGYLNIVLNKVLVTKFLDIEKVEKENWREVLEKMIEWQKTELEKMEQYLKEAEKYLVVNID